MEITITFPDVKIHILGIVEPCFCSEYDAYDMYSTLSLTALYYGFFFVVFQVSHTQAIFFILGLGHRKMLGSSVKRDLVCQVTGGTKVCN